MRVGIVVWPSGTPNMHIDSRNVFRFWRCVAILVFVLLAVVIFENPFLAQTAESLAHVKRVAVEWTGSDKRSAATRDRVLQKLKSSGAVELVDKAAQADAVLHGKPTAASACRSRTHAAKYLSDCDIHLAVAPWRRD